MSVSLTNTSPVLWPQKAECSRVITLHKTFILLHCKICLVVGFFVVVVVQLHHVVNS